MAFPSYRTLVSQSQPETDTSQGPKPVTPPPVQERGALSQFVDWINTPLVNKVEPIRAAIQSLAQPEAAEVGPNGELSTGGYLKAFLGGAIEGASKPSTLAQAASLGTTGVPAALLNIPTIAEGVNTATDPNATTGQKVLGTAQALTGTIGGGVSAYLGKADISPITAALNARASRLAGQGPITLGLSGANDVAQVAGGHIPQGVDVPAPFIQRGLKNSPALPTVEELVKADKTRVQPFERGHSVPTPVGRPAPAGSTFALGRAKGTGELSQAEQTYIIDKMSKNPKGPEATAIYGKEGQPFPDSVTDALKAEEAAAKIKATEGARATRAQMIQEQHQNRQWEQEAKNLNQREDFLSKSAQQEAKNLNERDKFTQKLEDRKAKRAEQDAAQEARNLEAKEKYATARAKEMDQQIAKDEAARRVGELSEGLKAGPATVTQKFTSEIPGGTETAVVRYSAEKPDVEGGGGGGGGSTSPVGSITPGGVIMDLEELLGKTPDAPPVAKAVAPIAAVKPAAAAKPKNTPSVVSRVQDLATSKEVDLKTIKEQGGTGAELSDAELAKAREIIAKQKAAEAQAQPEAKVGGPTGPEAPPAEPVVPTPKKPKGPKGGPAKMTPQQVAEDAQKEAAFEAGQFNKPTTLQQKKTKVNTGKQFGPARNPADTGTEFGPRYPEENIVGVHGPEEGPKAPAGGASSVIPMAAVRRTPLQVAQEHYKNLQHETIESGKRMVKGERSNEAILSNLSNAPVDQGRGIAGIAANRIAQEAKGPKLDSADTGVMHGPEPAPSVKSSATVTPRKPTYVKARVDESGAVKDYEVVVNGQHRGYYPDQESARAAQVAAKAKPPTKTPKRAAAAAIAPVKAKAGKAPKLGKADTGVQHGPETAPVPADHTIDVSTAKDGKTIHAQVMKALDQELIKSAGEGEITFRPSKAYGGREGVVLRGDEPIASIDRYGAVRSAYDLDEAVAKSLPARLEGVRDATPKVMQEAAVAQISKALAGTKGGKIKIQVGDTVLSVERNPVAIQKVLDRVRKEGPSAWNDLAGGRKRPSGAPIAPKVKKDPFEARRTELLASEKASGEAPVGSPRWQEEQRQIAIDAAKRVEQVMPTKGKVEDPTSPSTFSKGLQEELDYRLGLMEESAAEEGVQFAKNDAAIYQAIKDMERSDAGLGKYAKELNDWQIKKGVYREMSPEEIANTQVTKGKPWDLEHGGKKYKFEKGITDEPAPTSKYPGAGDEGYPESNLASGDVSDALNQRINKWLEENPVVGDAKEQSKLAADIREYAVVRDELAKLDVNSKYRPNIAKRSAALRQSILKEFQAQDLKAPASDQVRDIGSQVLSRMDEKGESIEAAFEAVTGGPARGPLAAQVKKYLGHKDPEAGFASIEATGRLASGGIGSLGGAAYGASTADEEGEDPIGRAVLGAILGGAAGAALPFVVSNPAGVVDKIKDGVVQAVKIFPDYQRGSLLFNMPNLAINSIVGPYGSAIMGSLEHAISGDRRGMEALVKLANPLNFIKGYGRGLVEAGDLAQEAAGRGEVSEALQNSHWLTRDVISGPGRLMTAGDISARDVLMSAGFTADEAKAMTLTDEPSQKWAQAITNIKRGPGAESWAMQTAFPFVRTVVNQVESGVERFPALGALYQLKRADRIDSNNLIRAQQILGTGVIGVSAMIGTMVPPDAMMTPLAGKILSNVGGQYGTLAAAAFLAGQALQAGDENALIKFVDSMAYAVPLPSTGIVSEATNLAEKVVEGNVEPNDIPNAIWPQALKPDTTEAISGFVKDTTGFGDEPTTTRPRRSRTQRPRRSRPQS